MCSMILVSCETEVVNPVGDSAKDQTKLVNYVHSLVGCDFESVKSELVKQGLHLLDVSDDDMESYVISSSVFDGTPKDGDYFYQLVVENNKISASIYTKIFAEDYIYSNDILLPISAEYNELDLNGLYSSYLNDMEFTTHASFNAELEASLKAKNVVELLEVTHEPSGKFDGMWSLDLDDSRFILVIAFGKTLEFM